jgi:hypothetical protein
MNMIEAFALFPVVGREAGEEMDRDIIVKLPKGEREHQ